MSKFHHEALTRRCLYENVLESLDCPLLLNGHRWCENEKSPESSEMILKGYRKFITHTCSLKKSQQLDGKNKAFNV